MTTTTTAKKALALSMLSPAPLDAAVGPFTFVIDGNLPSMAASPNATALLLSKATGAAVRVLDKAGKEVATADYATLEAAERERLLLGRPGGGRQRGAVPLTQAKAKMADLLRRDGGATRAELVEAAGKPVSAWGVTRSLAERLGLTARRDLNAEPPRFWLAAAGAEQAPTQAKAGKAKAAA